MTKKEKEIILKDLRIQLENAIKAREFEKAAVIRDQINRILLRNAQMAKISQSSIMKKFVRSSIIEYFSWFLV